MLNFNSDRSSAEKSDLKRLAQIADLPFIQEQRAKRHRETEYERRSLAEKLAAARATLSGAAMKRLAQALEGARGAQAKAREEARSIVEGANSAAVSAHHAYFEFQSNLDREIRDLETSLNASADPRISAFIEWAFTAHARTSAAAATQRVLIRRDPVTDAETAFRMYHFTAASVQARMSALLAAVDAAEHLRLNPDADIVGELNRLTAAIPEVDGLEDGVIPFVVGSAD